MIRFELDYRPFPKQSFRYTKSGKKYQPLDKKEEDLIYLMKDQYKGPKLSGPLGVICEFHYKYLKKEKNTDTEIFKDTLPDYDNLQKGLIDAAKKVVMNDDGQIAYWHGKKVFSGEDKIVLIVFNDYNGYINKLINEKLFSEIEKLDELYKENLDELYKEIERFCGVLAITHDSPDIEDIKEWFVKYEQLKNN